MLEYKEYRKIATVKARQMDSSFKVPTLEGTMTGNPGDYLCMGVDDELWPVKKEIFEKTYELVEKSKLNPQAGMRYGE